jgi:hypothetical protein
VPDPVAGGTGTDRAPDHPLPFAGDVDGVERRLLLPAQIEGADGVQRQAHRRRATRPLPRRGRIARTRDKGPAIPTPLDVSSSWQTARSPRVLRTLMA